MLVECPECQKQISSMADPCPYCGFPAAGKRSREMAEQKAAEMKVESVYVDGFYFGSVYVSLYCSNCHDHNLKIMRCDVKRLSGAIGFYPHLQLRCEKCGHKWEHIHGYTNK